MSETIAAAVLLTAYGLLWRHAAVKGRRLRAEAARAARLARWSSTDDHLSRIRVQIVAEARLCLFLNRPERLVVTSIGGS